MGWMIVCQHRRRQNAKIAFDPNPICLNQRAALSACFDVFVNAFFLFTFKHTAHAELACLFAHNYFPSSTWDLLNAFGAKCRWTQNPECKMLHSNLITLDLFMHLLLLNNSNGSCKIAFDERIAIDRFLLLYVSKNMLMLLFVSWSTNFAIRHSVHFPSRCAHAPLRCFSCSFSIFLLQPSNKYCAGERWNEFSSWVWMTVKTAGETKQWNFVNQIYG